VQELTPRKIMTPRLIVLLVVLGAGLIVLTYIHLIYVPYMRDLNDDEGYDFDDLNLEGIGIPSDPYLIRTAEDLAELAFKVNAGSSYKDTFFVLMNDIDLIPYLERNNTFWVPIGINGASFSGIFDGTGHTISGVWVFQPGAGDGGLFGWLVDAEIYNLNVEAISIAARDNVGALAGMQTGGKIINCTVKVENLRANGSSMRGIGGLVGWQAGEALIDNCRAEIDIYIDITGVTYLGGLVGRSENSTIRGSSAEVSLHIDNDGYYLSAGGLVGTLNEESIITTSRASGEVTINGPENSFVSIFGGFAGVSHGSIGTSYSSVNIMSVIMRGAAGGFVGLQSEGEIINCFATGNVSGYMGNSAGFMREQGSGARVLNCYYAGVVRTIDEYDPIAFVVNQSGIIENSFFDKDLTGDNSVYVKSNFATGEAVGRTTEEMQSRDTFEGWDFISTWHIPEDGGYPRFMLIF